MGTILPSTYKAQIGSRHQFAWNETTEEIGAFNLTAYPAPPALSGEGVVLLGRPYQNLTDTVTVPPAGVTFDLYRESDDQSQTITFSSGPVTIQDIIDTINAAFPSPDFAYPTGPIGGQPQIALIDKKPVGGEAGIQVLLSTSNDVERNDAAEFLRLSWGGRSTSATGNTTFTVIEDMGGVLNHGHVSDPYAIPPGADSISLIFRYATGSGVSPIVVPLWSDDLPPLDGSAGSLVPNPATGLGPIKTFFDYGFSENTVNPNPLGNGLFALDLVGGFALNSGLNLGFVVDATGDPIAFWQNNSLQLKPPPGATSLRLLVLGSNYTPGARPGYMTLLQAFAWASRQGAI